MKVASELKWGGRLNLHDELPLAAFEEHLCHNVHTLSLRLAGSKGSHHLKKTFFFMKTFHKMVTPPLYCICEILIQIFAVNELIYNRMYEI